MKRKILKTIFSMALVGVLSLSGVATSWTGMEKVEAAKVLPKLLHWLQ